MNVKSQSLIGRQPSLFGMPRSSNTGRASIVNNRSRSSMACLECRSRKIRCDLSESHPVCTNCQANARSCSTKRRTRRSRFEIPVENHQQLERSFVPNSRSWPAGIDSQAVDNSNITQDGTAILEPAKGSTCSGLDLNGWSWDYKRSDKKDGIRVGRLGATHASRVRSNTHIDLYETGSRKSRIARSDCNVERLRSLRSVYPSITTNHIESMSEEDRILLIHRQCFDLPSPRIMRKLLLEFFRRVHPQLPLLHEFDISTLVNTSEINKVDTIYTPSISLLVLHALIHVACSFLTKSDVGQLGFESIRAARLAYYQRAKVLFDIGFEKDNLAIAQGTLLLTLYTPLANPTAHTYWLAIAIQHTRTLYALDTDGGILLQRDWTSQFQRLWWCCILRDRSISIGLRRPLQISRSAVSSVPLLPLDNNFGLDGSCFKLFRPVAKTSLICAFNRYCALALQLGDALEVLYPRWEPFPSMGPSRISWNERNSRLIAAEHHLDQWFTTAANRDIGTVCDNTVAKSIYVLDKLSDMYYYAAKAAIHNHLILESLSEGQMSVSLVTVRIERYSRLEQAIDSMTSLLINFQQTEAVSFLPVAAVALAALPLAWHVIGCKMTSRAEDRIALCKRTGVYNKMLQTCQIMYEGTDRVIDTISELVSSIQLDDQGEHCSELSSNRLPVDTGISWELAMKSTGKWTRVLLQNPSIYVRVIVGLDVSLSLGRRLQPNDMKFLMPQIEVVMANASCLRTLESTARGQEVQEESRQTLQKLVEVDLEWDQSWVLVETDICERLLQGYIEAGIDPSIFP